MITETHQEKSRMKKQLDIVKSHSKSKLKIKKGRGKNNLKRESKKKSKEYGKKGNTQESTWYADSRTLSLASYVREGCGAEIRTENQHTRYFFTGDHS